VELNFSCPNSPAGEGEIFTDAKNSAEISKAVKKSVKKPVFIKVGCFLDVEVMNNVIKANAPFVDGVVGINTIKRRVLKRDMVTPALPGPGREKSGVCGWAIKECGLAQAKTLVSLREKEKYDFCIIGVGGIMTPTDIQDYLNVGVDAVQSCTGAMFYPKLAYYMSEHKEKNYQEVNI
jgi:dihydroorotate dehydrogenase